MNTAGTGAGPCPAFIERDGRSLFVVHYPPTEPAIGSLLYIPPFAEEMNRSRRMSALLGRALAAQAVSTLVLDLFGTGESSGEFADARWDLWLDDVAAAADWLRLRSGCAPDLLGLRLGAALAATAVCRGAEPERLIFWQPVGNGQTMLNQFLRIRIAADLGGSGERETTASLRQEWEKGNPLEVAGYAVHPALAEALDSTRLDSLVPPPSVAVHWIETSRQDGALSAASQRVIDAWQVAGSDVTARTCSGDPFWTLQETTLAPEMIEATTAILAGTGGA